jgi:hypothetical protein
MSAATSTLVQAVSPADELDDIELNTIPSVMSREAGERDPLLLRSKIVSDTDLDGLKQYVAPAGPRMAEQGHSPARRKKGKRIAKFYMAQNEQISDLLKPLSTLSAEGEQDARDSALSVKLAVNISFGCNCALAVLQLYAAIASGSLALFATCVDAGECHRRNMGSHNLDG